MGILGLIQRREYWGDATAVIGRKDVPLLDPKLEVPVSESIENCETDNPGRSDDPLIRFSAR